jgi:hypothetical protein
MASAWERRKRRPGITGALRRRVDAGIGQDLPDRGCGDLNAQDGQFTMDAPVSP